MNPLVTSILLSPTPAASTAAADFLADVLHGLTRPRKELPCKYFYDDAGSQLFDRICDLEEYYPTRCERAILERHAPEMAARFGPRCALFEYGSGSSVKTRLLLDALVDPDAYLPVDISAAHLHESARRLRRDYPGLRVLPLVADFTRPFDLPALPDARRRVVFFSGSTIGNFGPVEAVALLRGIAAVCGADGGLLIGVDLKKDRAILEPAYDDRLGVTAAFNLNLLARINRELGADFDLASFRHRAVWNARHGRIEMYLVSTATQTAHVAGRAIPFAAGEPICTEYSYKWDLEGFSSLAARAGLAVQRVWLDPAGLYSVQYAECQGVR
jgi:dimethylhistidine N-methyltransferase